MDDANLYESSEDNKIQRKNDSPVHESDDRSGQDKPEPQHLQYGSVCKVCRSLLTSNIKLFLIILTFDDSRILQLQIFLGLMLPLEPMPIDHPFRLLVKHQHQSIAWF